MDIVILGLLSAVVFIWLKIASKKPKDADGRVIMSTRDRIIGAIVLLPLIVGLLYVQVGTYGLHNPLILLSPLLIGFIFLVKYLERTDRKDK